MEEEDIYNLLRKDIINKLGKEILYGKDCVHLANQIYKHTRRQISSSTLKRFFGFLKTRFNPSKYTLETLVIFLGFKDWNDYLNCYDESKYNVADRNPWDFLKNRIQLVSKQSLDSLKQKTSYDPKKPFYDRLPGKNSKNLMYPKKQPPCLWRPKDTENLPY